ncbi:hypothetical protein SLEP1_g30646 [Rubroshorea leprosula]|uniref:HMA domain-containing protein n=1 Tax=Rubroshorea leprosula TaxID=152421 RepID=A0AAV5KAL9_9ROSI|nr:hypothetical protein SLEP1_g30646 [Rubroshorea leprosula]
MAMAAGERNKLQKSYFDVLGLCCSSEVSLIEKILKPLDGVKEVSVIVPSRTVIVVHDSLLISQLQIVKALNEARLEANVRAYGGRNYRRKWPSPFAVACGVLLALSFLKYVFPPFKWLAVAAAAVGIYPIVLKGYAALRNLRIDVNILMLIAVIGTIAMKDYIEAGTIVFLFTTSEWLESRASHKATTVMSSLMSIAPQKAVIAETGEEVNAGEVKLNTILAVKAGEVIPIDGIVVDGKCEVDEKTLTGESFPVAKQKDSIVWAGTINLNGYISVKTTAVAEDCVVAKMTKLVEEAQNSKTRTQRFIDKCAQFYTPAVILISASLAVVPAALRLHHRNHWFHLALVVLVSACPCALILSTPVATFCALTQAATSGLLVKGGDYLETLSKIKITAFDKTGTITRGEFVVTDFRSLCEDISLETLLYWVSSIECKSSHPMAAALVEYGRWHSIEPKPEYVEEYQNFPGEGIYGKIEGKDVYIGSRKISRRAGGAVPNVEGSSKEGKTLGYVYSGANPVGIFNLSDSCRTGAAEAMEELKLMGIKTAMLTGDNTAAASHVQKQLSNGLDVIHAELLPEDKAEIIKEFKKEGTTAMIGDGMNDAPALATADIGISMGISGSALATETGHVILMSNDIRKIPKAIQLARRAHRKVIENVTMSISTKTAILALAFAGHPLVWAAVLCDVGTCLLVILNSMLLLRGTHKHGGKCCKFSASSHSNKNGCKSSHCHSSHNHKHARPLENKVQRGCKAQKCSSQKCASNCQSTPSNLNSCGDTRCVSTSKTHDICVLKEESDEAKHCDHGSCNTVSHDIEASNCCSGTQNLSLCAEDNCTKLVENQHVCVEDDRIHGERHCHHHSTTEDGQKVTETSHHQHPKCCGENHSRHEAVGNLVEHSCLKRQDTESHKCVARASCMSLEKREVGGCCKSYRKECCEKHGHFGAGFGGGLTEIITE